MATKTKGTTRCFCGTCGTYVDAKAPGFFEPYKCPNNTRHKKVYQHCVGAKCVKCNKETVVSMGSVGVHEELSIIYYGCTSCGHVESEPID